MIMIFSALGHDDDLGGTGVCTLYPDADLVVVGTTSCFYPDLGARDTFLSPDFQQISGRT